MLKFLVKVFKSLYLLNLDTWPDVRYWSGFILYNPEPPQNFTLKVLVKDFRSLYFLKFELHLVDTLPDIRY